MMSSLICHLSNSLSLLSNDSLFFTYSVCHIISHFQLWLCVVGTVAAVAAFLKKISIQKKIAEPMIPLLVQPEDATKVAIKTGFVVGAA